MDCPNIEDARAIAMLMKAYSNKKSTQISVVEIRKQEQYDRQSSLCYVGDRESRQFPSTSLLKTGQDPRPTLSGYKWPLVVASIMLAMFLFALDMTIAADIAPIVAEDFHAVAKLPWVAVAFALGAVTTGLLWGKFYTIFDNKYVFICAIILFEIGSAVCGSAPSMAAIIVGRLICGIGGSGVYGGAIVLVSTFTRIPERPLYLSLFGLVYGAGSVLGPIIGGAFAVSSLTWRWSFYVNLPVGLACAPVYFFLLPSHVPKGYGSSSDAPTSWQKFRKLDPVGALLQIIAWTSFVLPVSYGGILWAWNSPQVIALLAIAALGFAASAYQQYHSLLVPTRADRLFPCAFALDKDLCILFAQTASSIAATFVTIYLIPVYFQFVRGASALHAATCLLPFMILMIAGVIFNGAIMGKTGRYTPFYLLGSMLVVVGGALMYTVDLGTSTTLFYVFSGIVAVGSGLYGQASFPVVQAKVNECCCKGMTEHDNEDDQVDDIVPRAVAFIGAAQMWGITIALTVANNVFLNHLKTGMDQIVPGSSKMLLQGNVGAGKLLEMLPEKLKHRVMQAIIESLGKSYILVITAGTVSLVLSLFMKWEKLFLQPGAM